MRESSRNFREKIRGKDRDPLHELYFKLNGEFTWAVTVTSRVVNSWVGETASAWACSIAIYPLCDHLRMTINLGGSSAVARRASEQPTGVMSQLSNQSQIQLQT